jgi:hypothetical protein
MSDFSTFIAIDIDSITKLLPTGSDIYGLAWCPDTNMVELRWGNRKLVTPFTFSMPYDMELLKSGKTPPQVRNMGDIPIGEKTSVDVTTKGGKKSKK